MKASGQPRFGYTYIIVAGAVILGAVVAGLVVISGYFRPPQVVYRTRDVGKLRDELKQVKYDDRKPHVAEIVLPSVVSIKAFARDGREVAGSGFIVDKGGYVLTAGHVIEGAEKIEVTMYDKRRCSAQRQGADEKTDIALLRIDAPDLEPVEWGDSDAAQIGESVLAVGDPYGYLPHTVTSGIVSQKGRNGLGVIRPNLAGQFAYEDFIQTNAALAPGDSGGPLFDMEARVIGVNIAIFANEQYGLAVPSNIAKFVAERLIRDGRVIRGYLGVEMHDLDYDLAATLGISTTEELLKTLGLARPEGVYVTDVLGRPAIDADIERGDVIVSIDGNAAPDMSRLRFLVADLPPGKTVNVEVIRRKQPLTLKAVVGEQPSKETHSE
jgi:serine protease Do